jgi:hypothetical protein
MENFQFIEQYTENEYQSLHNISYQTLSFTMKINSSVMDIFGIQWSGIDVEFAR